MRVPSMRVPSMHVPSMRVPPGETRSGERSQTSWAYYPKAVKANGIARSVITTYHFPYSSKICPSPLNIRAFFERVVPKMFR